MSGRKRTNAGADRRDPSTLRPEALALDALPPPPEHFGDVARRAYEVIIRTLASARAVAEGDAMLVVAAAAAFARWHALDAEIARINGADPDAPLAGEVRAMKDGGDAFMTGRAQARSAALREYRALAADLGMSPESRHRMTGSAQSSFLDALLADTEADEIDVLAPLDTRTPDGRTLQ